MLEKYKDMNKRKKEVKYIGDYNNDFLNDFLIGIHSEDFVLIASETGTGKSEFVYDLAFHNAKKLRVHLFALESDVDEPYLRQMYKLIAEDYYRHRGTNPVLEMSYRNYIANKIDTTPYEENAMREMLKYKNLTVHYREGGTFDVVNLTQKVGMIKDDCDMIILDHVDYFDLDGSENENAQMTEIMKTLRNINQVYRIPVIVVSHLRKKSNRKIALPSIDDLHGSSNKAKIAKTVILFAKDYEKQNYLEALSPTFCYVGKSRIGGTGSLVGILMYDLKRNKYMKDYNLGVVKMHGEKVEELPNDRYPKWAKGSIYHPEEVRVGKEQTV